MTKTFWTAACVLALTVAHAQEKVVRPTETTEGLLIANERALHDAVTKADKAAFQSLVLPEGIWATREGFIPMKLLADGLDAFQLTKSDIINPRVTWLDENSAIVLYAWKGTRTFQGQPVGATTVASTVWTKRNGKWVAAHHQDTDLKTN